MSPLPTPAIGDVLNVATSAAVQVAAPSGGPIDVKNIVEYGAAAGADAAIKAIPPEKLEQVGGRMGSCAFVPQADRSQCSP